MAALLGGDLDAAHRHLRAAVALAADGSDPRLTARAHILLAFASTFDDDNAARVEDLEHLAAEVAAAGDGACLAEALAACGQARPFRGTPPPPAARRHFKAAVEAARRAGSEALPPTAMSGLGSAELGQGDYGTAQGHLEEATSAAAACGDSYREVLAETGLAELALLRGDHDDAWHRLERCLNRARAMGASHPLARCLLGLSRAALEAGEPAEATTRSKEAGALARRAGLAISRPEPWQPPARQPYAPERFHAPGHSRRVAETRTALAAELHRRAERRLFFENLRPFRREPTPL